MIRIIFSLFLILLVGDLRAQCDTCFLPVVKDGRWGFIDGSGVLRVPLRYEKVAAPVAGLAIVYLNGKAGVIDIAGATVVPPRFESIQILASGHMVVKDGKYGLLAPDGDALTATTFHGVTQIDRNSFLMQETAGYRLFHAQKRALSNDVWMQVESINERFYLHGVKNGLSSLLSPDHEPIIEDVQADALLVDRNWVMRKLKGELYFYDLKGRQLSVDKLWKHAFILSSDFAIVYDLPSKPSLLSNASGQCYFSGEFSNFSVINERFLLLIRNRKMALGKVTGPLTGLHYDIIYPYADRAYFLVQAGKGLGLIDTTGKTVLAPVHDFIEDPTPEGLIVFARNNRMGLMHRSGKLLLEPVYDDMELQGLQLKAYRGTELDIVTFTSSGKVDEKLNFKHVHRITFDRRYAPVARVSMWNERDYDIPKLGRTLDTLSNGDHSASGRFQLVIKPHKYPPGIRMKTMIPGNINDIDCLVGVKDLEKKRLVIAPELWDVQLAELDQQPWARAILPGSRHALINADNRVINTFTTKSGGRPAVRQITYIGPFIEGLARINLDGSFVKGSDIKDTRRSMAGHELEVKGGLWNYVNAKGELAFPRFLEYASDFQDGRAIVKDSGKYGVISADGRYIIKPEYDLITRLPGPGNGFFRLTRSTYKEGLIDCKGRVVLKAEYRHTGTVSEGLVAAAKTRWAFYDLDGNAVTEEVYDAVLPFSEGLAAVKIANRWGFIDRQGHLQIEPSYSSVRSFKNGMAPVYTTKGWQYIDPSGNTKLAGPYRKAEPLDHGLAMVKQKRKWKLIDTTGKVVFSKRCASIFEFDAHGIAVVKDGRAAYLIDSHGKRLTKGSYRGIGKFSEGKAWVCDKRYRYGFIDTTGKVTIKPKYSGSGDYAQGYARVYKGGWGYIDHQDSMVIEPKFQRCEDFSEGRAVVSVKGRIKVIGAQGDILLHLPHGAAIGRYKEGYLSSGKAVYNLNGEVVLSDILKAGDMQDGVMLVWTRAKTYGMEHYRTLVKLLDSNLAPIASYDGISTFNNGYAKATIHTLYGISDVDGNIIMPAIFQNMSYIGQGIFMVQTGDELGYIKDDGNWLWAPSR